MLYGEFILSSWLCKREWRAIYVESPQRTLASNNQASREEKKASREEKKASCHSSYGD